MSAAAVRDAARACALTFTVPIVDVVGSNLDPGSLPDEWGSVIFEGFRDAPIGIGAGSTWREEGTVTFVLAAKSGQGDTQLTTRAGEAVSAIRAYAWGAAGIHLLEVGPLRIADEGGDGRFLFGEIDCPYEFDHA